MKELFAALSKCQSQLHGAVKDSTNPFFNSKYADLESVWESIRKPLTENGLCVIQTVESFEAANGDIHIELVTTLAHISGESIISQYPIVAKDKSPQALGSAITYARRYALAAIVGVYQIDDDGNQAQRGTNYDNQAHNQREQGKYSTNAVQGGSVKSAGSTAGTAVSQSQHGQPTSTATGTKEPIKRDPSSSRWYPSDPQLKRLFALMNHAEWTEEELKLYIVKIMKVSSSKDLDRNQYDWICNKILAEGITYDAAVEMVIE